MVDLKIEIMRGSFEWIVETKILMKGGVTQAVCSKNLIHDST